ncbi:nuclease-related domain-containing protein [Patulibacter sp.]|uniref:nuclease-related domain-containing protein n=1 Tax=Patulibacter sp. TaxID=1912859 RepID=UPI00351F3639
MARLLPSALADDLGSRAERRIFDALRDETPASWVIFHSVGLAGHPQKRWGELDLVVVCEHGVICPEVKGGSDRGWRCLDVERSDPRAEPVLPGRRGEAWLRGHLRDKQPDMMRVDMRDRTARRKTTSRRLCDVEPRSQTIAKAHLQ